MTEPTTTHTGMFAETLESLYENYPGFLFGLAVLAFAIGFAVYTEIVPPLSPFGPRIEGLTYIIPSSLVGYESVKQLASSRFASLEENQ